MAKINLKDALSQSLETAKLYIDTELAKKADSNHGTHVTYATSAPKANGTAAVGTVNRVAREDHVHPLQTTVSGNAGTATKLATTRAITIGNKSNNFDGSAAITYTLADIGAVSQTDFDAFNIGGRNYITDSKKETSTTSTYQTRTLSTDAKTDLAGKVVTASFDLKGTTAGGNIYVYFRSSSGSITPISQTIGACTAEYKRYTITFTAPSDLSTAETFGFHTTSAVGTAYIKNVKVELGNRASSWCPAVEDALVLGETSTTAYRGDRGKTAYNHSQAAHAPSNAQKNSDITKAEIEAKLTGAITTHTHNYLSLSGGTLTGNVTLQHGTASKEAQYMAERTDTGVGVWLGVGSGGTNHGVYSQKLDKWMMYADASNVYLNGNATSATKVNNNLVVKLNGGSTEGTNLFTFNGSAAKTVNITPSAIGAAASSHTHNYAGSSSAGGAANSANILNITSGRTASANSETVVGPNVSMILATSTMTTGKPASDGYITEYRWDNNGGWSSQFFVPNNTAGKLQYRSMNAGAWGDWNTVYSTCNKPTPADIGAAASGHTHSYLPLSGGTMTGKITSNVSTGTDMLGWATGAIRKVTDQGGTLLHCDSSLFLHAGDSGTTIAADEGAAAAYTTENMYLSADGSIQLAVNTQNGYASATKFTINTSGFSGNAATATKAANSDKVGGYSVWVGTQAQYDAISSKSSTTLYYITG